MSFVVENLGSATDDRIPSFLRTPENGTTSDVTHQTLYEFSRIGKGARIINNDSLNNLDVRLHDPNATIMVIPPNSELIINEWFAFIKLEPDASTGSWQLTLETSTLQDAQRRGPR